MRGIDNLRAVMTAIGSVILAIGIIGNYYFFDFIDAKNADGEREVSSVSAHIVFDTLVFVGLLILAFIIAIHYNNTRVDAITNKSP